MKRLLPALILVVAAMLMAFAPSGCNHAPSSDSKQQAAQERILEEGTAQTGMPNIKNFRERKLLKDILEMRDQDGLVTYTYLVNELTGKLVYLGESIGYGLPYSTQYTNPEKISVEYTQYGITLPQADPNGLFSPGSAEGTWVLLKGPTGDVKPVYVEPRIIVSPFRLAI
jgi:hypothetical protein